MLGWHKRSGRHLFFLCSGRHLFFLGASRAQTGQGRRGPCHYASRVQSNDADPALRALGARTSGQPTTPASSLPARGCARTAWQRPAPSCSAAAIRCSVSIRAPTPAGAARAGRSAPRPRSRRANRDRSGRVRHGPPARVPPRSRSSSAEGAPDVVELERPARGAQPIQRIGRALADAEDAERAASRS
jgi:hypothetical protein